MPEYDVGDRVVLKDDGQTYKVVGVRLEDHMVLYDIEQGDERASVRFSVLRSQLEVQKAYTPKRPQIVIYKKRTVLSSILLLACFLVIGHCPISYGQADEVDKFISYLKSPDANLRVSGAEELGAIKDPRGVVPLIALLKDKDAHVRYYAARSLGFIEDPRAVDGLIIALKDIDPAVRRNAARALGQIRDFRAVDPLIGLMKDPDPKIRLEVVIALSKIKDIRAYDLLMAAKKDPDADVQKAADKALGDTKKSTK